MTKLCMFKLVDQSSLFTKTGHNYWKYSRYSYTISRHIGRIKENIGNSKDDYVRIRANDIVKESSSNFIVNHYTSIGPGHWNDIFHTLKLEDCPVLKTRS